MKAASTLEQAIVRQCLDYLNVLGIPAWRQNTGGASFARRQPLPRHGMGSVQEKPYFVKFSRPGAADITGILPGSGRRLEIEVKRPGGKPNPDQVRFHRLVNEAGGVYLLVHSVDELKDALHEHTVATAVR